MSKAKSKYPLRFPFNLGFEIHQQLKGKLFCNCKTKGKKLLKLKNYTSRLCSIENQEVKMEEHDYMSTNKICNYEIDEKEPVINLDIVKEAILISQGLLLEFSTLKKPLEKISLKQDKTVKFTFQRKKILDGSLFSGFQRTAIIGKNKELVIRLQEDSCSRRNKVFDLSRQGTALLEVTSRKFIINNQKEFEDFLSFLEEVGDSIRESNVEKDSASIRQDINISIKKGEKVEIKGVSSLSGIRQVIVKEIERQEKILPEGYQITPHTRCIDNPSAGTTSFMRPYKGNTRYFSEPELSSYAISLSRIELEKRLLESLILKIYLNLNLQKEIRARGLLVLLEKLKKMKVKSLLELTIGQISSILRGFTRLNYREVVKKLKDISTFEEARLFLRNSLITCDKKILISIYEKIKLSKENVSLPLLVDLLEKNLLTKEEADILFEKYMTLY